MYMETFDRTSLPGQDRQGRLPQGNDARAEEKRVKKRKRKTRRVTGEKSNGRMETRKAMNCPSPTSKSHIKITTLYFYVVYD